MKTVATLWLKGMLREPEAIDKNLGGSRTPRTLNLLHYFTIPPMRGVISATRATGSRKVRPNIQQYQDLQDVL
jgi:hypothetical protein